MINYDKAFDRDNQKFDEPNTEEQVVDDATESNTFVVKVITKKLNLRSCASKDGDVLAILDEGAELLAQEIIGDLVWYKVYTEAGLEGYVMRDFVE